MLLKNHIYYTNLIIFLVIFSTTHCKVPEAEKELSDADSIKIGNVEEATDWTNLFYRKKGWFGGDGIFAIPLNGREFVQADKDSETLILFSDTMIGEPFEDLLKRGEFHMINNSVAILKGSEPDPDNIRFYYNEKTDDNSGAIFVPEVSEASPGEYYWLGDGFVNVDADSTLYIFGYRIKNIEKTEDMVFPFKQVGISLISVPRGSNPPFNEHRQVNFPFYDISDTTNTPISFGSGIFVNTSWAGAPNPDGYIYIYGTKGMDKELMVARVKSENFENFEEWRFWDGKSWNTNINSSAAVAKHISNEMSVTPIQNGKYLLTYQYRSIQPDVAIQIGDSPVGPFGPMKKVWSAEDAIKKDDDFFAYNAKAHPNLSPEGAVLISYNVNSFDFHNDIIHSPNLYRPRFILLEIEE